MTFLLNDKHGRSMMTQLKHCQACQRSVPAKRHFGVGTLIFVIMTLGWGILLLPFWKKRCTICKSDALQDLPQGLSANTSIWNRPLF